MQHQFDGLAKLTKYRVDPAGKILFQTRMLRSDLFNRTQRAAPPSSPWALWTEPALMTMLAVEPTYTPCQRVRALIEDSVSDNTNIFIGRTGNTIYARSDSSISENAFDLATLESRGHTTVELEGPRRVPDTITGAHNQRVINGTATIGWSGRLDIEPYVSLSSTIISVFRDEDPIEDDPSTSSHQTAARRRFIGQIKIPLAESGVPMVHSFQVTKRYIIMVVCSLRVEPSLIGSKLFVLMEPFEGVQTLGWRGGENTTVYVMDIESQDPSTGPLRTFSVDPMYMNHHINAWESEDGNEVTMDVIAYKDGSFLSNPKGFGNLDVMRTRTQREQLKALRPTIRRYALDMQLAREELVGYAAREAGNQQLWADFVPFQLWPDPIKPYSQDPWPAAYAAATGVHDEQPHAAAESGIVQPILPPSIASPSLPHGRLGWGSWTPRSPLPRAFAAFACVASEAAASLGPLHMEMPRFNDKRHGSPYRYVWGVGSPDSSPLHVTGLVKVDLGEPGSQRRNPASKHSDALVRSWYRPGHFPSEPIFVPRPGSTEEDDGVVMSVMLDGAAGKSYLLILDAATMQTLATAYSPVIMPSDFHGEWFADE